MNNTSKQVIRVYPGERICQVVFQKLTGNLSPEEIKMHGLQTAKYTNNDKNFAGGKVDKKDEIELIKLGKIDELKKKYHIEK